MNRNSVGVLWATHLVDEVEAADRVIILHRGKVLEEGGPSEIAARSGAPGVAEAFLAMTSDGSKSGSAPSQGNDNEQRTTSMGERR